MRIFLAVLVSIVLFCSCSIQKRRYTSGYHVEWQHCFSQNERSDKDENAVKYIHPVIPLSKTVLIPPPDIRDFPVYASEKTFPKPEAVEQKEFQFSEGELKFPTDTIIPTPQTDEKPQPTTQQSPLSKISSGLGIGSLGVIPIIAILILASANLFNLALIIAICAFICAIAAVICSSLANRQIDKYPERYHGKTEASIGLITGWIYIGLFSIAMTFLAALMLYILYIFSMI